LENKAQATLPPGCPPLGINPGYGQQYYWVHTGKRISNGTVASIFFDRLSEIINHLPNDATIHIDNLPSNLNSHGIKSWLNLNYPTNHMNVVVQSESRLEVFPGDIILEVEKETNNDIAITVRFHDGNNKNR
jgi:hypothetical protein